MVVYFHPEFPFIAPNPWLLVLLHIISVVWGTWMFHQVLFPIFPVKGINNDCINFLYSSSIQTMQWNAISLRITARSIECMNSTCCTEIVFSLMGVISVTRDVAFTLEKFKVFFRNKNRCDPFLHTYGATNENTCKLVSNICSYKYHE